MVQQVISVIISFVVSGLLGYCLSTIKNLKAKKKDKEEEEISIKKAIMTLLQSNLTNTYFVYENQNQIPDYIYKNWLNELKVYESLGGNDYVHTLAKRMEKWELVRTDILNK